MTDLLWPGDDRAGELMSDAALLEAMVRVEQAWLDALVAAGLAPTALPLAGLVGPEDVAVVADGAEGAAIPSSAWCRCCASARCRPAPRSRRRRGSIAD